MAYEPLHHKYRPQTFAELVGQEAIATTLRNALRQQKIAPAYLFTGARGTGKTSSARILAKSLNCLKADRPTETPCGICEVCRSIANGSALDVIEIDAASNTGVDNIRELIERSQFAPVQCRYKVYVVDECHMLSTAAFNALLKTLEEPPDRVIFVLATTDPQRVLPTIISRCQRFDFRRIELSAMVQHLAQIATQEAIDITPEAIQLVAQIAQGGLRDAESTLDQLSLLEGQISVERVWDLVGAVPERDLLALVEAIVQNDTTDVIDRVRHLLDRGREPLIVLQNLASFYRDLLIAKTTPDRLDLVAMTPPTWAEMAHLVQSLDIGTLLQSQQHLRASEVQIKNSTQPRLWLEVTLLGLLSMPIASVPQSTPQAVPLPRSSAPASSPAPAPRPPAAQTPTPPAAPATTPPPAPPTSPPALPTPALQSPVVELPPDPVPIAANGKSTPATVPLTAKPALNLEQIWQAILNLLQPPGTQALFKQQGCLLALEGTMVRIGISSQPLFKMAQQRVTNLEAAFEKHLNYAVRVSLEVIAAPPPSAPPTPSPIAAAAIPSPAPSPISTVPESALPIAPTPTLPPSVEVKSAIAVEQPVPQHGNHAVSEPAAPYPAHSSDPGPDPLQQSWQSEDEVSRAAKSLAQMFNGQVVSWEAGSTVSRSDELEIDRSSTDLNTDIGEDGDPDDDVPF